jgi:hypothetical protein
VRSWAARSCESWLCRTCADSKHERSPRERRLSRRLITNEVESLLRRYITPTEAGPREDNGLRNVALGANQRSIAERLQLPDSATFRGVM